MCRRSWTVEGAVRQQNPRDLGTRVIKHLAADHDTSEKGVAWFPQPSEQPKADTNCLPPTVTQAKHSKGGQRESEAIFFRKVRMTANSHYAGCYTLISTAGANTVPRDRFNNKVIREEHRGVGPAVMFVRESSRPLSTRDRAAYESGRHVAIKNQIARTAFTKIWYVPKGTNGVWQDADRDLADVENRIGVDDFLRQSTPPALQSRL